MRGKSRPPAALRKKLTKLVKDCPILSPMQMLNSGDFVERWRRPLAYRRSSRRFSPNHTQGWLLALDLQNGFSYCSGSAKGIAVNAPSCIWFWFMEDST
jgi:hypothetical protein